MKQLNLFLTNSQFLRIAFWILALLLGGFQAWCYRYNLSSEDIISYLDISDFYGRGDWDSAINGYWSPLYSWLLLAARWVFDVAPAWEFPAVKLTNFLIYIFALVGFEIFLKEFIYYYNYNKFLGRNALKIPEHIILILGYSLFLLSTLKWTRLSSDTPDLCAAALVYLATGLVLRFQTRSSGWFSYVSFGIVLGLAYLGRAAALPVGFTLLLASIPSPDKLRATLPKFFAAMAAFICVSSPYIAALSIEKGRLTFSETGKLAYVWLVNPGSYIVAGAFWQGEPPEYGTPLHPPRKISDNPEIFEFAEPIKGTYPIWTDASYWYEGLKVKFNLKKQAKVLMTNFNFYWSSFLGCLVLSYLLLATFSGNSWKCLFSYLLGNWRSIAPALIGLTTYIFASDFENNDMPFQPNTRYIAVFIVILYFGTLSSVRLPNLRSSKRLVVSLTLVSFLLMGVTICYQLREDFYNSQKYSQNIHWQLAQATPLLGINPEAKIAIIGNESSHVFWARLARVKIVAQVPSAEQFWTGDNSQIFAALEKLKKAGATAAISRRRYLPRDRALRLGWQEVGKTGYFAYSLEGDKLDK